jgi:predicted nucleic acid-binding protein
MVGELILIDSNVLIRWVQPEDPQFSVVRQAIKRLGDLSAIPCYTSQNLGEFWNVLTRPTNRNGYGLSLPETILRAELVESRFTLLPDNPGVHQEWRRLLVDYGVLGVQVHDARLVAAMRLHGIERILTFNAKDFVRFDHIKAVHPSQL